MGIYTKIIPACLACLLLGFPLTDWAVGLGEAYRAALEKDPDFRSAYYAYQAGSENGGIGRSNLFPEVTLSAREARNKGSVESIGSGFPPQTLDYNSSSTGVYLRQPLFSLEKYARYKQGSLQAEMAEKAFQSSRQDLAVRVVSAYLDAVVAKYGVSLVEAHVHLMEAQYEQARRMLVAGEDDITDVDSARTKLKLAEVQHMEFVDRYNDAKEELEDMTQLTVDPMPSFRKLSGFGESIKLSLEQAVGRAVSGSPDVQEKVLAIKAAEQSLNQARAGYLPTLDLTASYSRNNQDSINIYKQKYDTRTIGVEMQWSLLNGGQTLFSARKANAQWSQAQQDAQVAREKIKTEVGKQYHAAKAAELRVQALVEAIEADKRNVEAMRAGARLGVRTSVDVAGAEKELAQTIYDHADATRNYIVAVLKLSAAMGVLQEDKVAWAEQFTATKGAAGFVDVNF